MDQTASNSLQQRFWNEWNTKNTEFQIRDVSARQAEIICKWLNEINRTNLMIAEIGCGSGWFCPTLAMYGSVVGTDLSDEVLARARHGAPGVTFIAGDFMTLEMGRNAFDVVVSLEVLSHVADQRAFLAKLASHLRPSGLLMMATQNRFVLENFNDVPPPAPGQLRRWVDQRELRALLAPEFDVREMFSINPRANRGFMRLVNSTSLNRPIRALVGNRLEWVKERMGLGWSLMVLARKREGF